MATNIYYLCEFVTMSLCICLGMCRVYICKKRCLFKAYALLCALPFCGTGVLPSIFFHFWICPGYALEVKKRNAVLRNSRGRPGLFKSRQHKTKHKKMDMPWDVPHIYIYVLLKLSRVDMPWGLPCIYIYGFRDGLTTT